MIWLDHSLFYPPGELFSDRGYLGKKHHDVGHEPLLIVLLRKIIKAVFFVVPVISLENSSQTPVYLISKDFHPANSKEISGPDIAFFRKTYESPGQIGEQQIQCGRFLIFIGDKINQVALLKLNPTLQTCLSVGVWLNGPEMMSPT